MKKTISIQHYYFSTFLRILFPVVILCTGILCVLQYRTVYRQSAESVRQTCTSIAENIDLQIRQMDTICLNAISSSDMRSTLEKLTEGEDLSPSETASLRSHLSSVLTSLKGFDYSIRQLSVYSMDGEGFGAGLRNGRLSVSSRDREWYDSVVACNGKVYISAPSRDDDLAATSGSSRGKYLISLYHMYFNAYHSPTGIVEVRKYYDDLFSQALQQTGALPMNIYVFASDGALMFPLTLSEKTMPTLEDLRGSNTYLEECTPGDSRITVAVTVERINILIIAFRSLVWILAVFAMILLFIAYFSRRISVQISAPIRRIHGFLSSETRTQFSELDFVPANITEIDDLQNSINNSIRSQKAASDTLLTLKESELQARMLALQSQMNPHFLYNSLSTIAQMAREGLNEEVVEMAVSISQILREISSDKDQFTTVEDELELTSLYLGCIKIRYKTELMYRFEIPDEMLDCTLPKLCVQSLVENSIKYVTKVSPPWDILIKGEIINNNWTITVSDNGPGFDPQVDRHLRSQMDSILANGLLPSLQIEGMGILNIFIRLYLKSGIPFIFDFGNRPEGGAFVTIGGYMKEVQQEELS